MAISIEEEIGKRYGRLTVVGFVERRQPPGQSSYQYFSCLCDCGVERVLRITSLRVGNTRSCGCLQRDIASRIKQKHGGSESPEYEAWLSMKQRCYSHNKRNFADYGGRGIMVCERWRNSFENFLADMGPRPTPLHSIDRIDNSLGYDPANCRWATRTEQNRNKRSNRYMTMNGRTMILTDWAIETGIKRETIKERIRRGWTISRALTTPPRPQKQCSR